MWGVQTVYGARLPHIHLDHELRHEMTSIAYSFYLTLEVILGVWPSEPLFINQVPTLPRQNKRFRSLYIVKPLTDREALWTCGTTRG
jgi:hypothetical protein